MPTEIVGLIGVGLLLVFIAVGMPIALAAALTGFLGLCYLSGSTPALSVLRTLPYSKTSVYSFSVLPLFILMGYFAFHSGLATQAFEAGKRWLGRIPGGLALATVAANAVFGAACGVSLAATSVMGRITIPEMEKLNYQRRLAAGVVAATGTFAAMIPPSAVMIVYAIMAEESAGKMLLGGLFPGLITAVLYGTMLYLRVKRNPSLTGGAIPLATWRERLRSLPQLWAVGLISTVIIGGIYTGVFTPTEAGGISAFIALVLLLTRRGIDRRVAFKEALLETGHTTAMIFLVLIGVVIFATFIAMSQLPYVVVEWIGGLDVNRYIILVGILVFYLVLGMFMEVIGILVLSLPVVLPIIDNLGFHPIWFGVIVVKTIEIAMVTPPVGLNVYVVKGVAPHIPLEEIFRGIIPFIMMDIIALIFMVAFPQIVLFLPSRMK